MNKFYNSILAFIILIVAAKAYGFQINTKECIINKKESVRFQIDNQSFGSLMQFEVFFNQLQIPQIRLHFLEHEPTNVMLQWDNEDLQKSAEKLFNQTLSQKILSTPPDLIPLTRTSTTETRITYETNIGNLLDAQILIALFLSQNHILVVIESDAKDIWTGSISLKNSDLAFRKLAASCHKDKSAQYLNENGDRIFGKDKNLSKSEVLSESISNGYGLTDHMALLNLLPQGVLSSEIYLLSPEANSQLINLLNSKKNLIATTASSSHTSTTQDIVRRQEIALSEQKQFFTRLQKISGDVSNQKNLLTLKKENESQLMSMIQTTEQQINEKTAQLQMLQEQMKSVETAISPFLPKIESFEKNKSEFNNKISNLQSLSQEIDKIHQKYNNLLKENQVVIANQIALLDGPWSIEELRKKEEEYNALISQYQFLNRIKQQLTALKQEAEQLSSIAQEQEKSFQSYLQLFNENQKNQIQLKSLEKFVQTATQIPYLSDIDQGTFSQFHSEFEVELTNKTRDYVSEFAFHESQFQNLKTTFQKQARDLEENNKVVFTKILCDPAFIIDTQLKTKPCLNISEISQETTRNIFIKNLPPSVMDELIPEAPKPWNRSETKAEYVMQKLNNEIEASKNEIQSLMALWFQVRLNIWRWNTQQKMADEYASCNNPLLQKTLQDSVFSAEFYLAAFECERQNYEKSRSTIFSLREKMATNTSLAETAKSQYQSLKEQFSQFGNLFSDKVNSLTTNMQEKLVITDLFVKCLMPLDSPLACAQSFDGQFVKMRKIEEIAHTMSQQAQSRTALLQHDLQALQTQLVDLQKQEQEFLQTNNLVQLMEQKLLLPQQQSQQSKEFEELSIMLQKQNSLLTQVRLEVVNLKAEETVLLNSINTNQASLESLKQELLSHCQSLKQAHTQLQQIDNEVLKILSRENATAPSPIPAEWMDEMQYCH